mmetsp:Transcript_24129/g.50915  ORF Transcript_24129/g.50915 Transcript_24129/m.50915 type:complete len:96 (-) Transcript_24129:2042-2329(-)
MISFVHSWHEGIFDDQLRAFVARWDPSQTNGRRNASMRLAVSDLNHVTSSFCSPFLQANKSRESLLVSFEMMPNIFTNKIVVRTKKLYRSLRRPS